MPRIKQLDPTVVNKIAAGEVIERPASVVKELLENSIDALATRIEVDISQGGSELIRVSDDGEGIHPDDLCLAVSSHATSKIETPDDLFAVQTMGFRGEALASIASISRFRVRTRQADAEAGTELEVHGGAVQTARPCGCSPGTTIEVKQLFYNTPVRRKFLKTIGTEFGHISEQFARVALANPRLHMVLRHNGKAVYELPGTSQLLERLRLFYGAELAERLIWVESESRVGTADDAFGESARAECVRIWGYVAHPSVSKSSRKNQYLFLNGRWIQDRALQHALTESYRGLLMVGRHPVVFLFIEMPASQVDINVHPCKWEVRFRDSQQLYRQLLSMIRNQFLSMDLESHMRLPGQGNGGNAESGSRPGDRTAPPHSATGPRQLKLSDSAPSARPAPSWPRGTDSWPPTRPAADGVVTRSSSPDSSAAPAAEVSEPAALAGQGRAEEGESDGPGTGPPVDADTSLRASAAAAGRPAGRAIQVHDCYLVIATDEGLMVIDQHALHERVMYEQLRPRVLQGKLERQKLLIPETIECSPSEAGVLLENQELLEQLGFGIEDFGGSTILLTSYPAMLRRADRVALVRDICEHLESTGQKPTSRDILDSLLHMMACKAAIKSGQRLTPEEMDSLLEQRHLVDDAHHCPHGRPTALLLSRTELDKQFGRLG